MKRITHPHSTLAALLTLGALSTASFAEQPAPAGKTEAGKPAAASVQPCLSPEQLLQKEPTAAGPLSRAAVIKELQRARAAGEMDWHLRDSTGYLN